MEPNASKPGDAHAILIGADSTRLLAMARDRSIAGRETLAASISTIVCERGNAFSSGESALMDDILRTLIRDVERSVRQTLATHLAKSDQAPPDVIAALARDDIEVAYPLLVDSPLLDDAELKDLIESRASGHRIAIAMRKTISSIVSDALIETADVDAIVCLLNNEGAELSEAGLTSLVDNAPDVPAYHQPLAGRNDLSQSLALKLASAVSENLRAHLVQRFDLPASAFASIAADAAQVAAQSLSSDAPTSESHGSRSREIRLMIDCLKRQEWPQFEAAMVRFAAMPPARMRDILYETGGQRLAALCKASGISKSDFASIYIFSRKASPGSSVVEAEAMQQSLAFYDQISKQRAQSALTRWRSTAKPSRS